MCVWWILMCWKSGKFLVNVCVRCWLVWCFVGMFWLMRRILIVMVVCWVLCGLIWSWLVGCCSCVMLMLWWFIRVWCGFIVFMVVWLILKCCGLNRRCEVSVLVFGLICMLLSCGNGDVRVIIGGMKVEGCLYLFVC